MLKRVLILIVSPILFLCIQIEAAQAGILQAFRHQVEALLSPELFVLSSVLMVSAILLYFAFFDKSLSINGRKGKQNKP